MQPLDLDPQDDITPINSSIVARGVQQLCGGWLLSSVLLDLTAVILLSTRIAGGSTDILIVIIELAANSR